jgi:metal-dependent amidase/aminoacylase/carboxypeptidase family protein
VVAVLRNGAGPTVLVRTELDALPMEEKTGLPYASRVQADWNGRTTFVDHSCGHDIHMASWVGTAKALVSLKDQWTGTLMFIAHATEFATNPAFQLKLALITAACLNAAVFHRWPFRTVSAWDVATVTPTAARVAAVSSLLLWAGTISCGRLLAYL